MKRILLAVATVGALVGGSALAMQISSSSPADDSDTVAPRQRLVIGLDLSRSNPLISDSQFAARVAARIAGMVRKTGFASEIHVRTFGNYDATSNTFAFDTVISRDARPERVAADIQGLISGTPFRVKSGAWRAQENTNIIAFLDNVSQSIGCDGMPTTVVLASDGIEDSDYARLDRSNSHLPMPDGRPFKGCGEFDIFGLGKGADDPRLTTRLRADWSRWAHAAGFARFQGLNDW